MTKVTAPVYAFYRQAQLIIACTVLFLPDDQNALVNFLGSFPQGVLALLFVHAALLGIPFRRKVEVVSSGSR